MTNEKSRITDKGREGKYFHILYNMADDELNPYQYRLYGHYKRVCGEAEDGACWESTRTTAEKTQMSTGKVSGTRQELQELGYITIEYRGGDETCYITLIDRMADNIARYTKCSPDEQGVHVMNASVHQMNGSVHEVKQRITKEEKPPKKNISPNGGALPSDAKSTVPSAQMNPMKDAIATAFDWSWETMTKPEKGVIQATAKELCEAGYTPENVPSIYKHCKAQFSTFTPRALATHASEWRKTQQPQTPPRTNGTSHTNGSAAHASMLDLVETEEVQS